MAEGNLTTVIKHVAVVASSQLKSGDDKLNSTH